VRACGRNALRSWPADEFVEPRLHLRKRTFRLGETRRGARVVLFDEHLAGCNRVAFGETDCRDWFVALRRQFDTVRCQFADDTVGIFRFTARADEK
jgi:hypothetical protein